MEDKQINILNPNITDEYILYQHNYMKDKINLALSIVRQYILENELLVVGGMAIDFALKLHDSTLYNDEYQIPDFDIMSPNNVYHANKIGTILCSNEFKNVSVISAIHHTTVRVQLLGFTVFDSTFVPEYIYNKIPFLLYNDFRFIHPIFQKINQLLSLSFLFTKTGPEYNIIHRFKKDIKRFDLLDEYYNVIDLINFDIDFINNQKKNNISINLFNNNSKIDLYQIDYSDNNYPKLINDINITNFSNINNDQFYNINSDICFHGIIAYNLIYQKFNTLIEKLNKIIKYSQDDLNFINKLKKFIFINNNLQIHNNILSIELFDELSILTLINNNDKINVILDELKNNNTITNIEKKNNILDYKPKYSLCKINNNTNLEIFDLYGSLLSINILNLNDSNYVISNYNYNLVYFLLQYYLEDDDNKKQLYLYYYISLKNMIQIIQFIYNNYTNEFNKIESFYNSVFNYSINTLGIDNFPHNYLYFVKNFNYLVYNNKNLNELPGKNFISYPDCEIKKIFDMDKSSLYELEINKNINNTNYKNELINLIQK